MLCVLCRVGAVCSELEAALMSLSPSELVVVEPLSAAARKLLDSFTAATPGCRMEILKGVPQDKSDLGSKLKEFYAGRDVKWI